MGDEFGNIEAWDLTELLKQVAEAKVLEKKHSFVKKVLSILFRKPATIGPVNSLQRLVKWYCLICYKMIHSVKM